MRKILAVCALMLISGCAAVKQAGSDVVGAVANPPNEILDMLKQIGEWLVSLLVGFFTSLYQTLGL